MSKILLKNGTALLHDATDHVEAVKRDILIESNKITKIASDISSTSARIINCDDKIISPGFVDTHHHVWQTQLKGRHANHTLLNYFPTGNFTSKLYNAEDTFWGQLGGCLEMIDGGTTTVADFAHINISADHSMHTHDEEGDRLTNDRLQSHLSYCCLWDPLSVWVLSKSNPFFNRSIRDQPEWTWRPLDAHFRRISEANTVGQW